MRLLEWYLKTPPPTAGSTFLWWETRRLPYNLVVLSNALVSLMITLGYISRFVVLGPGEDPIEPILLILGVIAMNFCYTVGGLFAVAGVVPAAEALKAGTLFSLGVVWLPSVLWSLVALVKLGLL
jgi:hypothetical protein